LVGPVSNPRVAVAVAQLSFEVRALFRLPALKASDPVELSFAIVPGVCTNEATHWLFAENEIANRMRRGIQQRIK